MRFQHLLALGFSLAATLLSVSSLEVQEPEIQVVAAFPEDNPFGHVVNGEKNKIILTLVNKSSQNVTVLGIGGSFHHPDTNVLIKNTSTQSYNVQLIEDLPTRIPYTFYSEFKPGDLHLNLWLEHKTGDKKYRVSAYDSVITIVEPEASLLDFQLISTYAIVAAIFGGLLYLAYISFVPQTKKNRSKKRAAPPASAVDNTATATGTSGYQEEWIPDHHIKKTKVKTQKSGVATSGDEHSAPDTSGNEGRRRKGKK